jgi:hypothetical protein
LLLLAEAVYAAPPVKVLIVTGWHDHPPSFYSLFDDASFVASVNPHPIAFAEDFRQRADVLVLYDMIPNMPEEEKRTNLRAFVESGKGVVVLHHAIIDHQTWPWGKEVVGGRYLLNPEGEMPAAEIPEDCTAITSATGATPVSIVSTVAFCDRPLSNSRKSEASRPSIERPFRSVTVTGTSTKREPTSKRGSWAAREAANASTIAHLITALPLHSNSHQKPKAPGSSVTGSP